MITNISRQLSTGALALAGTVAALSFAGAAQAATIASITVIGAANVDGWGTVNPILTPTSVGAVTLTTGQFVGVTAADVTVPSAISLTGTGAGMITMFTPPPASLPSFTTITIPSPSGNVIANLTPQGASGMNSTSGGTSSTSYSVAGTVVFDEPTGPDLVGTFSITFSRSGLGSGPGTYTLTLDKTGVASSVPEPSAILGILAVAGVGAFACRKS
jgi:hypothetical protein